MEARWKFQRASSHRRDYDKCVSMAYSVSLSEESQFLALLGDSKASATSYICNRIATTVKTMKSRRPAHLKTFGGVVPIYIFCARLSYQSCQHLVHGDIAASSPCSSMSLYAKYPPYLLMA